MRHYIGSFVLAVAAIVYIWLVGGAQISGKWDYRISLLPSVGDGSSRFAFTCPLFESWMFAADILFNSTLTNSLKLELKGGWESIYLASSAQFDLLESVYKTARLSASWEWQGVSLSLEVTHWGPGYAPSLTCLQTDSAYLRYRLSIWGDWWKARVRFEDCCTGIEWLDANLILTNMPLCDDFLWNGQLMLSKANGFERLEASIEDLKLCPGCFSLDAKITFTSNEKSLSLSPKLDFLEEACFTLYGQVDQGGRGELVEGLVIKGFRITCSLDGCHGLEIKTTFSPGNLGFSEDEFEYIKLTGCLPTCCGEGTFEATGYFGVSQLPFGLTRMRGEVEFPLSSEAELGSAMTLATTGDPELELWWSIRL